MPGNKFKTFKRTAVLQQEDMKRQEELSELIKSSYLINSQNSIIRERERDSETIINQYDVQPTNETVIDSSLNLDSDNECCLIFHNRAYNPSKKYAVVLFIDEGSTEVIPTNWIVSENETRWPNVSSCSVVAKYIRQRCLPTDDWTTVKIKIYGFSNSFETANEKASHVEGASNRGRNSSEKLESSKRKRKRPTRYESDDFFSDLGSDSSENIKSSKRKRKRPIHYQSDDSFSESESKRKRKRRIRYQSDDSFSESESKRKKKRRIRYQSDDSFSENESVSKPKKKQPIPKLRKDTSASSQRKVIDSTHHNYPQVMSKRIFECLELLHDQMKELNTKYSKIVHYLEKSGSSSQLLSLDSELPPEIVFPINSDAMLSNLNEKIKNDSHFSSNLIRYLYGLGYGKSPRSFILRIAKKLLTADLAATYSRFGRKGKKSFSEYSETLNVILAAASLQFQDANKEELAEMFGKCLAGASEWNGRKIRVSGVSSLAVSEE